MTEYNMDRGEIQDLERHIYGCWLSSVPGVGSRTIEKLLKLCGSERAVYAEGERAWRQVLTARQMEQITKFARMQEPEALYTGLLEQKIGFVMQEDAAYPVRLRKIPDPPYGLFVKGRMPSSHKPAVAIVGARDCSEYGGYVAASVGALMGDNDIQVISGMARGIDGISQRAALEVGGSSFGVLGCGVDVCYPASNRGLYEKLCEKGGVLSAYPPKTEARPGNFPPRNRIVSGLSDILIVVEARAKSGTLITVDMALEQGKDVYVVPGRITDRLSDGCNRLLKQGAEVFLSPEDFLKEVWERWGHQPTGEDNGCKGQLLQWRGEVKVAGVDDESKEIYDVLGWDVMTPGQIGEKMNGKYTMSKVMSLLMGLCVRGLVTQVTPGYFVRKRRQEQ